MSSLSLETEWTKTPHKMHEMSAHAQFCCWTFEWKKLLFAFPIPNATGVL